MFDTSMAMYPQTPPKTTLRSRRPATMGEVPGSVHQSVDGAVPWPRPPSSSWSRDQQDQKDKAAGTTRVRFTSDVVPGARTDQSAAMML